MSTISFIGAGSMVFATNLVGDILSYDALADSEIRLMDVDEDRLEQTRTVESTTDRSAALDDADYVLNMINVGGREPFENEIRIPEQYGIEQAIGDTTGPGGVFRGLRTIPTMLDLAEEMEELCPDALLLNYTNPMAIVCKAVYEATDVEVVGLCHSVPHTAEAIAEYVDVPQEELDYWVSGINHMAFFHELSHEGESLYPELRAAADDEETYRKDTVRFEMLRHFGRFPTESSHHLSEYVPYFRTDEATIEAMAGTNYAERMETGSYLDGWTERSDERDEPEPDVDLEEIEVERSEEYAARLIHSLETDTPRRFNLNLPNHENAIGNLPNDACVEVPAFVDGAGVHPCAVEDLPPQIAALDQQHTAVYELAVEAALDGDREKLHQAIKLDPLSAAVCTLDELHEMTEALIEANEAYLPDLEFPDETRTAPTAALDD